MPKNNKFNQLTAELIESFSQAQPVYANSLILTIFGDSICSHGGTIWLGSLIKMVQRLGVNQRLVRTSVFRLTEKGVLQSQQIGRRSFYSLTEKGFRQFATAAERIYRYHDAVWDGEWRLVFTTFNDKLVEQRERLQKELVWLGFSRLAAGIYGHPTADLTKVGEIIHEMELSDSITTMQARVKDREPVKSSANLVKYCFQFDVMKDEYQVFIRQFKGILKTAKSNLNKDEELCFLLRTLLIHQYRRILLREPELPHELVPTNCLSHQARELTENLYKQIAPQAENYLMQMGESEKGRLPKVKKEYFTRFGGLK